MNIEREEVVLMSPNNGSLVVGIPLYWQTRYKDTQQTENTTFNISMSLLSTKASAYIIDYGDEHLTVFSAEWVDAHLENLGEL